MATVQDIQKVVSEIIDPELGKSLQATRMLQNVTQDGSTFQVPIVLPTPEAVLVDLQSTVTQPGEAKQETINFQSGMPLDRVNLLAQQFMTTLRMPTGKPVLVAGSTIQPQTGQDSSEKQLYLVLEVSVAK